MTASRDHIALLTQVKLFADLSPDELRRLAELFHEEFQPANHRVFSHGDDAKFFYVIRDGSVAIFKDEVGKPVQLQTRLGPGDYFGEMGIFDGFRRSASARTSSATRLLRIDKDDLLRFLERYPGMAVKLQIAAARRHSENVIQALNLGTRHEVRIRLDKPMTVDLGYQTRQVRIINLSLGGLCLSGVPAAWQKGQEVHCTLAFGNETLEVHARVSWREDETVGLAFLATNLDQDLRVQRLLRRLLE